MQHARLDEEEPMSARSIITAAICFLWFTPPCQAHGLRSTFVATDGAGRGMLSISAFDPDHACTFTKIGAGFGVNFGTRPGPGREV